MQIIILKNKIALFIFQFFTIFICCLSGLNESFINDQFKSNILLYFSPKEIVKKKNEETFSINILYLGNLYEAYLSSHFGGQLMLKDLEIQNKYYIVVSDQVEFLLDNNSCIKGYKIQPQNIENAKMYVMYLIITTNEKNSMTYNWNIEEINIPERSLPDNAIIINSDPKYISFNAFDEKFNKTYPNSNQNSFSIILPQVSFDIENLYKDSIKNYRSTLNTNAGHKKILQSIN